MTFNQFVWRNIFRNRHLYVAFFLSVLFSVVVLFSFLTFLFHPEILAMGRQIDVINSLPLILAFSITSVLVVGFSFFFILHSLDIFLHSRKREFGTFIMQGLSTKQLKKMVFLENIFIGFFASIGGILIGLVLVQIIFALSRQLLGVVMPTYFPLLAMLVTFATIMFLFLFIFVFVQRKLPKMNLQELLKSQQMGKGELNYSIKKAIASIVLIALSYLLSVSFEGQTAQGSAFLSIILSVIGSKMFFTQATVLFVRQVQKRKNIYWKQPNLLVFSDLAFRMKDAAKAFFLVTIISSAAIASVGLILSTQNNPGGLVGAHPYEFSVSSEENFDIDDFSDQFNQALADNHIKAQSDSYQVLVMEQYVELWDGNEPYEMISLSDYNRLAKMLQQETLNFDDNQAVLLTSSFETFKIPFGQSVEIGSRRLAIQQSIRSNAKSSVYDTLVVTDAVFEELQAHAKGSFRVDIWQPVDANKAQLLAISQKFADTPNFFSKALQASYERQGNAPFMFAGLFLGMIFLFAGASFLYFRLFSDKPADIAKFRMVYKMGLTPKELRKAISQQVGILFLTPLALAFTHGLVALIAINRIIERGLQVHDLVLLGIFLVAYVLYYLICRSLYCKNIEAQVLGND